MFGALSWKILAGLRELRTYGAQDKELEHKHSATGHLLYIGNEKMPIALHFEGRSMTKLTLFVRLLYRVQ
ncbi:MAG: hypothetical protein Q8922_07685 [Bacteroidota bacterium]|nr:hypothetical protein [Bacteroidota bacterium]